MHDPTSNTIYPNANKNCLHMCLILQQNANCVSPLENENEFRPDTLNLPNPNVRYNILYSSYEKKLIVFTDV